MTFQIKAEVLLNNANWEKNLKKTQRSMNQFGKSMKTISGAVKGAIAFMGINAIGDGLMDAAKSADEDAKSMRTLNKVLENSWKATDKQTDAVDKFIQKTSVQVGILDDQLRPAFAKIATTTKDPTLAMERFTIALDVAAGTGKDLNVVSLAMAKFFGGQTTALDKLVPGIKNAGDKVAFLTEKYKGAAQAGAGAFDKINVAMDNIKEQLGAYLLPYAEKFATWLSSPEAQAGIDEWVRKFGQLLKLAEDIINKIVYATSPKGVQMQIDASNRYVADYKAGKYNTQVSGSQRATGNFAEYSLKSAQGLGGRPAAIMNITVNGVTNPKQVVTELQKLAQKQGIPLSKLLK